MLDTFIVLKQDPINTHSYILNSINAIHESVKFELEEEKDGNIVFLDLCITRINNQFDISVYRKPTFSGRYIDGNSCHPKNHIYSAFYSMVHRAVFLPLNYNNYTKEIQLIKTIAINNNINPCIVDKAIHKFQKMKFVRTNSKLLPIKKNSKQNVMFGKLPYYPVLSEKLQTNSKKFNINFGLKPTNTIKSFMPKIKQQESKFKKSGIYKLNCNDCNSFYIGQTSRSFEKRFKEHECSIRLNHPERSHFAQHILDSNHNKNIDFSNMEILNYSTDYKLRNFMESYFIKEGMQNGQCVNAEEGPCRSNLIQFALNL